MSNKLALALAGLALVVASTGTAVAVTSSQVTIADPTVPARVAHVDSSGRLQTYSTLNTSTLSSYTYSSLLTVSSDNFFTTPTTANLALTSITLSHPAIVAGSANVQLRVLLYKAQSSSKTTCTPTAYSQLMAWNLEPGDDIAADLSTPLLIKPTGTTPYCLSLFVYTISGGAYGASYYPFGSVSWYAEYGTYAAAGATRTLTPAQVRGQARRGTDR